MLQKTLTRNEKKADKRKAKQSAGWWKQIALAVAAVAAVAAVRKLEAGAAHQYNGTAAYTLSGRSWCGGKS